MALIVENVNYIKLYPLKPQLIKSMNFIKILAFIATASWVYGNCGKCENEHPPHHPTGPGPDGTHGGPPPHHPGGPGPDGTHGGPPPHHPGGPGPDGQHGGPPPHHPGGPPPAGYDGQPGGPPPHNP